MDGWMDNINNSYIIFIFIDWLRFVIEVLLCIKAGVLLEFKWLLFSYVLNSWASNIIESKVN